jgi:lysophospholipase L1-like esterase
VIVLVVIVLAGLGFAVLAFTTPGGAAQASRDIRRTARETLGLPKFWYDVKNVAPSIGVGTACPEPASTITIVTGGQSNAGNALEGLTATTAEDQVFAFDAGKCFIAADPMAGASGRRGSLWPDLGRRLHAATGRPVLFINGGIGGFQVADWLDRRSGFWDNLAGRIAAARALGFEPQWILWHQGETDASTGISPERFRRELGELTADLLAAAPRARLYLFQTTLCTSPRNLAGVPPLRAVQQDLADASPRIVAGLNTDTLDGRYRWDGCHFNAAGREAINAEVARDLMAAD